MSVELHDLRQPRRVGGLMLVVGCRQSIHGLRRKAKSCWATQPKEHDVADHRLGLLNGITKYRIVIPMIIVFRSRRAIGHKLNRT